MLRNFGYLSVVALPQVCNISQNYSKFSVTVGLLSPCVDSKLGAFDAYNKEWSSVLRCAALFFGFSHATARIDFATYSQLSLTAIGLSIALWWVFDRSLVGFVFGMAVALLATFIFQSFVWKQLYR